MLLSVAVFRPHFVLDGWTTQKHPGDVLRRRDAPRFERDRRALGRPRARAVCVGREPGFRGPRGRRTPRCWRTSRSRSYSSFASRRRSSSRDAACLRSRYGWPAATANPAFSRRWPRQPRCFRSEGYQAARVRAFSRLRVLVHRAGRLERREQGVLEVAVDVNSARSCSTSCAA